MICRYTYIFGMLKIFLYKVIFGKKLIIRGLPKLSHKSSLRMRKGAKIVVNKNSYFAEGTLVRVTENAEFSLGKNSGFNSYCLITCRDRIIIGDNVMFGPFVTIHDHDHIYQTSGCMKTSGYKTAPIIIEDNVWIGTNVTILKGVTIGTGSVVAAGTIVTKDVPPHTIVRNEIHRIDKAIERK